MEQTEIDAIDAKFMQIREQEGGYTEGDTLEDTSSIEEELIDSEWVTEAEQIPLDLVTALEREYLLKCINHQIVSDEDKEVLGDILAKYRPAIQKLEPQKIIENVENNQTFIEDEKAFLQLVDESDEIQVIPFTYTHNGKVMKMKFDVYPIENSKSIQDITENLSMFKDLTEEELIVQNKVEHGEKLTREELIIRAGIDQKIKVATYVNSRETAIEFLALQLKFHGKDSSIETMRNVFSTMNNRYLGLLFDEVQRLSHIHDVNAEEVFQPFD